MVREAFEFSYSFELIISFNDTVSLSSLGISIPICAVPGTVSTTLRLGTVIVLAKSLLIVFMVAAFVPATGSISNKVTIGPGLTALTFADIP